MVDELTQLLVADLALTDLAGKINVVEDTFEGDVFGFDSTKRLVELVPNILMGLINGNCSPRVMA